MINASQVIIMHYKLFKELLLHYDWTVQVHIHPIKLEYRIIYVLVNSLE